MKSGFISIANFFYIWLVIFQVSCGPPTKAGGEASGSPNIFLADPTILYYNSVYYLYGTVGAGADNGFLVYTSTDMKSWSGSKNVNDGYALRKGDVYGTKGFWAPQVFVYKHKFYMVYVANENIAIAESESPLGPFTQKEKKRLETPGNQIDPFVYIDDDGKKYLYHVRLTNGNKIFVAEMTDDLSAIKPETLHQCIAATQSWENTANAKWPVTEGPTVLKRNNLYYLFYTANDFRNPDYAMGYAVSKNAFGPWEKYPGNPILTKKLIGINGPGHGDLVVNKRNKTFFVFHTHNSDSAVFPRKTAIVEVKFSKDGDKHIDKLIVLPNTSRMLRLKKE